MSIQRKKHLAQSSIEVVLIFSLMIFFSLLIIRVWAWSIESFAPRQINYNNTRVIAGIAPPVKFFRTPVIWPIYQHRPLNREEVFGSH